MPKEAFCRVFPSFFRKLFRRLFQRTCRPLLGNPRSKLFRTDHGFNQGFTKRRKESKPLYCSLVLIRVCFAVFLYAVAVNLPEHHSGTRGNTANTTAKNTAYDCAAKRKRALRRTAADCTGNIRRVKAKCFIGRVRIILLIPAHHIAKILFHAAVASRLFERSAKPFKNAKTTIRRALLQFCQNTIFAGSNKTRTLRFFECAFAFFFGKIIPISYNRNVGDSFIVSIFFIVNERHNEPRYKISVLRM